MSRPTFVVVRHAEVVLYYAAPPNSRWTQDSAQARRITLRRCAEILAEQYGGVVQELAR